MIRVYFDTGEYASVGLDDVFEAVCVAMRIVNSGCFLIWHEARVVRVERMHFATVD